MKIVTKHFNTMDEADRFQNRLYDRYDHVKPISDPYMEHGDESGKYSWEVE